MAIEEVGGGRKIFLRNSVSQIIQEFSIEIPDKEADAIHSGMRCAHLSTSRSANGMQ